MIFYSDPIVFHRDYRALHNRTLDMMGLVAAVSAGWLDGLGVPFTGAGEVFYEAAIVLNAFVLLGQWFEIRRRTPAHRPVLAASERGDSP